MRVSVEFLSLPTVVKAVGGKLITLDFRGQTVSDLITELGQTYGPKVANFLLDDSGRLDMILKVLLNEREWIHRDQLDKLLQDGDKITIMMLAAGG